MKLLLLFIAGLWMHQAVAAPPEHPVPANATLEFIQNKGQWDARVRYLAPLPGGARLFAETTGLTLALLANGGPAQRGHGGPARPAADSVVRGHALRLRFEGAAPTEPTATDATTEHRNYLLGAQAGRWAQDVRSYRALHYANLWPGVSARVYESADQHLEYDFELAAGASPAAIGLRHDGATGLALDAAGNLLVRTSVGTVVERAPRAWQLDAAGRRQPVACRYTLAGRVVRFKLGRYDARRPLTIDPVVVFATYSGSTADNWGFTATYDDAGNLYSGGIAFGVGYPATAGAFQTTFAALIDIAIIKYNTQTSGPAARVWATYIGGDGADFPHSLVVNKQNELLLLGSSGSADYPTTAGAVQTAFGGGTATGPFGYGAPYDSPTGSDIVVTHLTASGAALVGSTYLGGSGNDGLLPLDPAVSAFAGLPQLPHNYGDPFRGDILVDDVGGVYIASHTTSADFPAARGLGGGYRGGTSDAVVCKLTAGLSTLAWASFLGGSGADAAYSLQLEPQSGDVYVAGGTLSPNFPTTAGAYRGAPLGNVDGFVARIGAGGQALVAASYVGTPAYDQAFFLQLGTDGGVYLLGQTLGAFPRTPGLFSTANGTQFIQKLAPDLGSSLLATAFGSVLPRNAGRVALNPTAFLVDRCDRVYVCGWGGQVNGGFPAQLPSPYLQGNGTTAGLPLSADAFQTATDSSDFYLAQFAPGLTGLTYGTYYGNPDFASEGEHVDGGTSRFDPRGIVYQAVCACFSTTGFPIPAGANTYSTTNNSGQLTGGASCNNAAFVINFEARIANAGLDQTVCATAGPQPLLGSPAGGIWSGPGVSGSVAAGFVFTPTPGLVGVQTLTYTVPSTGLCTTTATRRITVPAPVAVAFTPLLQAFYCLRDGAPPLPLVALSATPVGGTFSGPGVSGSAATGFVFSPNQAAGTIQLLYAFNDGNCLTQAVQSVTFGRPVAVSAGADTVLCPGSTRAFALRGSPAGGTFSGPGVSGSTATGFMFTPPGGFAGGVSLTYTAGAPGCTSTGSRRVAVAVAPLLSATWAAVACAETRLAPLTVRFTFASSLNVFPPPGLLWDFGDGTQSTEVSPTHTYATPGRYQPVVRVAYNNDRCEAQAQPPAVEVQPRSFPNIITPNGDQQNETFRLGPDCPVRLQVYSRWGQKVFEAAAYRDDWNAAGQPNGVYYYLITYPNGQRTKGWVEVLR